MLAVVVSTFPQVSAAVTSDENFDASMVRDGAGIASSRGEVVVLSFPRSEASLLGGATTAITADFVGGGGTAATNSGGERAALVVVAEEASGVSLRAGDGVTAALGTTEEDDIMVRGSQRIVERNGSNKKSSSERASRYDSARTVDCAVGMSLS